VAVVKQAELAGVLPADTAWVSPEDRQRQLAARRAGHARRFAEARASRRRQ
jgi:hypothetical protein